MQRPDIKRFQQRLKNNYVRPKTNTVVLFQEPGDRTRTFENHFRKEIDDISQVTDAHFTYQTIFGPVPIEFDGMYPFGQTVLEPQLAAELANAPGVIKSMKDYSHKLDSQFSIIWDGPKTLDDIKMLAGEKNRFDLDEARMRAIADYQFGPGAAEALIVDDIKFVRSKNTGKIRNIISKGEHILSLRAEDGLFTLKPAGALRLHNSITKPRLRVVVESDAAQFNREGKNVFSKFVKSCDPGLRPGDEALITDDQDMLVAIGRILLTCDEMLAFNIGIAVRVREGFEES
jgi:7-cyano-7-deazaguanine tRNA-ribosyltransferase